MPMNISTLKALLCKRGYIARSGKGSHSTWTHPAQPTARLVLHGADGDDEKWYQRVRA